MLNVLEHIPYEIEKMGKRILVNEPYLQLIQIALNPGQSVPPHNANSNVHLLTVQAEFMSNWMERFTIRSRAVCWRLHWVHT